MLLNTPDDTHLTEPRITERWFRSRLDMPHAEGRLYRVLQELYPGTYIEDARMRIPRGPFMSSWRRPDFAASLITGQMRGGQKPLPYDAHIEIRLYGEPSGGTTVLVGISALGQSRPRRVEAVMLDRFEQQWGLEDSSLYVVSNPEYAI